MIFLGLPAAAEEQTENIRLYNAYWNKINVGDLVIKIQRRGNDYRIETDIQSHGIANAISGYSGQTVTEAMVSDGKIIPLAFRSDFETRHKPRHIEIKYAPDGKIISEINNPPENRDKRPEVEKKLKDGSYDPLSAALLVREKLRVLRESGQLDKGKTHFTIPLYDGRRRSNLEFIVYGREKQKIGGNEIAVIHIGFTNQPVAGYTQNEIRALPTHNPIINAYIEDNDLLLPVKGDGETRIGFAYGDMAEECKSFAGCGIK